MVVSRRQKAVGRKRIEILDAMRYALVYCCQVFFLKYSFYYLVTILCVTPYPTLVI